MEYRCLHIITRLANGGAEETVLDLLLQLAQRGIYCDLAVGKECVPEVLQKYTLPPQCNLYTIDHMIRNPHPIYEIRALQEIRALIRANQYNIVQTHGSKAGILGRIAAHKEHVPVIIGMIHGISFPPVMNIVSRTFYKALEKYTARLSHALVCVGEDMRKKYIKAHIGSPSQYSVIYTGMNLDSFIKIARHNNNTSTKRNTQQTRIRFGLPQDSIILGSIGRLEDRKNQQALITMLPDLLQYIPNIHICFIGDGPNLEALKNTASSLGVLSHVSFTGYLAEVWHILPALDMHCMVSLWEGLPRVLVQTSAAGLPNICYEVDGAWEIIENNVSGYIIPRDDKKLFIEKVVYLANNHKIRLQYGAHAVTHADHRWSLKKFGDDMVSLYQSLLKE